MQKPLLFLLASTCTSTLSLFGQGAVIVRIPDGSPTACIDASKDKIYLTLRRVITNKKGNWLVEDKSVGVVINATVQKAQADNIKFPLMSEATLSGFSRGQVSVPIEYTVVSGFPLKQEDIGYEGVRLEMTFLNKKGRTSWGRLMQALAESAKDLPIPTSPATVASSYVLKFANNAVQKEIDAVKDDEKAQSATLALNFDPSGKCEGKSRVGSDFERTGTLAIVQATGGPGGLIDISKTNEYCWTAELTPAFVLKAAAKNPNKACDAPDYRPEYKQVSNNYIGFRLEALTVERRLGVDEAARKAALQRCQAHGIPPDVSDHLKT